MTEQKSALLQVNLADYADPADARLVVELLDAYARDPMGGGEPLPESTREELVPGLQSMPGAFSLIGYVDGEPAGLVNCFMGFSTFVARPLVNIHDVVVLPQFRGRGLSAAMLHKVDEVARSRNCCKVTLEVVQGNLPAKAAYRSVGFKPYNLDEEYGQAEFWHKYLS
ncbi:GNAT family N-acetyltransferase [Biformimicrobium ophioploci]|uniref:GNAT family N-acetyltransferase n=1 Tax=Biformimicrobium ophioploci TaxID=3036711 RepID=A0ABQ6LWP2_9GAMM|nr:GNAT family N-acetyltransferase [Microbulbifer sp. NKW57]GMG86481.1 GNAT family N-acetyltransferase [Microbulbifer sp. NKW57]